MNFIRFIICVGWILFETANADWNIYMSMAVLPLFYDINSRSLLASLLQFKYLFHPPYFRNLHLINHKSYITRQGRTLFSRGFKMRWINYFCVGLVYWNLLWAWSKIYYVDIHWTKNIKSQYNNTINSQECMFTNTKLNLFETH